MFYGSESVEDAKQLLWQSYSSHLRTYPQHKGKKSNEKKSYYKTPILSDKAISTPILSDTTIPAPILSHVGDNQSDLNTLIDPCAETEETPSEALTSSVLDKSRSEKMDSPLHTPCLINLDGDITIETMVIPETQSDI